MVCNDFIFFKTRLFQVAENEVGLIEQLFLCGVSYSTLIGSDYFFTGIGSEMRPIATVSYILWSVYPTFVTQSP